MCGECTHTPTRITHLPGLIILILSEPHESVLECLVDLLQSQPLVRAAKDGELRERRDRLARTLTRRRVREGVETQVLVGTEPKNPANIPIRSGYKNGVVARTEGGARGASVGLCILGLWRGRGGEIDTRLAGDNVVLAQARVKGGLIRLHGEEAVFG